MVNIDKKAYYFFNQDAREAGKPEYVSTVPELLRSYNLSVQLYFTYSNFCRIHKSLSVTPAVEAGLMKKPMTIEDIAHLILIEAPKKRGLYAKKDKS
ncbi:MAG TPA: hypothetical protein VMT76_07575 [Puia sp.]|nr:hypothetical protein [Puia sp.]